MVVRYDPHLARRTFMLRHGKRIGRLGRPDPRALLRRRINLLIAVRRIERDGA